MAQSSQTPEQKRWSLIFDTDTRYYSWQRTGGNPAGEPAQHGWQSYTPVALQAIGTPTDSLKVEVLFRGGHVTTSRSVNPNLISGTTFKGTGFATGSVSTTTDSIFGLTFTYLGFDRIQPFYAPNFNLPTGRSVLFGLSALARSDPDLVEIPTFGQGFNATNTFGVNIPFTTDIMLTLSGAYTSNGAYDREKQTVDNLLGNTMTTDIVRPSDNASVNANLAMALGAWTINLSGLASWDVTASRLNGAETFRNGQVYFASGSASYKWSPMWTTNVTGSYSHTHRMFVADPATGALLPEHMNSNSDIYRATLMQSLYWNTYTFNLLASFLYRNHNEYDLTSRMFVPAKTKWSIGGSGSYAVTDAISLNARVEHFWIHQGEQPDLTLLGAPVGPSQRFDGWVALVGGTAKM